MITLLDCIKRIPSTVNSIVDNRKATMAPLLTYMGSRLDEVNEIIFVGSGTSNTSAMTSRGFVEKVTMMRTTCILPNEFLNDRYVFSDKALYVFTSQSGTSYLTKDAIERMHAKGCLTVAMTEAPDTMIAKLAGVHVDLGCGKEEYGMRTIGYCSSILTHMLMGLELGLSKKIITVAEYDAYIKEAREVAESQAEVTELSMKWFDANKDRLMNAENFVIYGADSLWGVALEGALKIMEISKRFLSIGYEVDDGMHGPTMGFTSKNCVILLNDGGREDRKMMQLADFVKTEMGNGFLVGANTKDDNDLAFTVKGGHFRSIAFSAAVQVLAYRLAVDYGIDLTDKSMHKESKYFMTHDKSQQKQ